MWVLVFSNIWKTIAWQYDFTNRWGLNPYNYFNPATLYWSACTKPGKWEVMYLCIRGIDFVSVSTIFLIAFWNCSDSVVIIVLKRSQWHDIIER
jgi:hypothetical protein